METISIIVPIFQGRKYIDGMILQLENCAVKSNGKYVLELILINDDSEEQIGYFFSDKISIKVIETDRNRGIHGARVRGLDFSTGDYVIFLDQDDVIHENYMESQYSKIQDFDAVVCRLVHGGKLHYTDSFRFEEVITKEFMLHNWCPIVSPGQVLIRRGAVPDIWKKHILVHNGADDYFLWLCMMAGGRRFSLNQDVLFEHIITGKNISGNTNLMMDSECEMIEILLDNHIFSGKEAQYLRRLPTSLRRIHITQLEYYKSAYDIYDIWIGRLLAEEHPGPEKILYRKQMKTAAIYGAGVVGQCIFRLLKYSGIQVLFYIDRNAEYIHLDIPVFTIEDAPSVVDGIIISLHIEGGEIKRNLEQKFACQIYQVDEWVRGECGIMEKYER